MSFKIVAINVSKTKQKSWAIFKRLWFQKHAFQSWIHSVYLRKVFCFVFHSVEIEIKMSFVTKENKLFVDVRLNIDESSQPGYL